MLPALKFPTVPFEQFAEFSNSLVSFERFALFSNSLVFRAVCSLFSNSLVTSPFRAVRLCSVFEVSFERFAPCSPILYSLSSGLFHVLQFPSPFRAVCSLFSNSQFSFERFAPCLKFSSFFRAVFAPCSVKFPAPFRAVCALFSHSLVSFERFLVCALFSNSLLAFERFAPCYQILYSLSSASLTVIKFSCLFRAACSLFSNALLSFGRFAPSSQIQFSFERFALCSPILPSLSSGLRIVLNCLVSFERLAPCSQILYNRSSGLLLVLKFPSPFRPVCSLFSNFLRSSERFAPCSQIPFSFFRAVCALFQILESLSSGLLLVLKFSTLFQAVCSLFSNSLVPFEWFAPWFSFSSSLVCFERFAPCSQILYSLSSGLLPGLKFPSPIRALAPCSQFP